MRVLTSDAVEEIICRGSIKDSDVSRLSRSLSEDGTIEQHEAEQLLAINKACPVQGPAWRDFFVDAITDYLVRQLEPAGYVTAEKAHWLISQISQDGRVTTKTELDLLVRVLDKARWVPASLVTFSLAQVRAAVVHGDGPLRLGQVPIEGVIAEREVELIRTMLCSLGSDSSLAITRAEAEMLLDINAALQGSPARPAWTDLFVKAVANVLMSSAGYAVPPRKIALGADRSAGPRREPWPVAALATMVALSLNSVREAYHRQSLEERALSRLERQRIEIVTNEEMTEIDGRWLADRLSGDIRLSATEEALLAYARREKLIADPLAPAAPSERDGKAA
jgi:hypothetical protein